MPFMIAVMFIFSPLISILWYYYWLAQLVKNLLAIQEDLVQFLGWEVSLEKGVGYSPHHSWASLVAQMIKNLPAMRETWLQSLIWEDLLEECVATLSSILAWRIPMERGARQATVNGAAKSQTWLSDKPLHYYCYTEDRHFWKFFSFFLRELDYWKQWVKEIWIVSASFFEVPTKAFISQ